MNGYISKIQSNSTDDGPGLRTTVYAVGCPLNCLWCTTPELIGGAAKFLYHPRRCVGCGSCVTHSGGGVDCYYDAYEQSGEIISVKDLVTRLRQDKQVYEQTGGGVTFSGGDPCLQADFFYKVAEHLVDSNIHIALDTAGFYPWEKLAPLVAAADLVLYDIKTLNRVLHRRYTGVDNHLILDNALRIADMGIAMTVRMILIPGVNDSESEISGRLTFVKNLGKNVNVEIIKYRKLGTGKYASLGTIEMMAGTPECDDELITNVKNMAKAMGIEVIDGG
ncbi:MAG: radical SAM protein [Oscillospiraceae bacterium]|jgi:pyruvate formate lyase activating enzyme|nr:radical SAM protein [Oscillospiraceae bacterium]